MKKLLSFIAAAVICAACLFTAFMPSALAEGKLRLNDEAHLLSSAEYAEVLSKLDAVSEKLGFAVVIYTVEKIPAGYGNVNAYADDLFDEGGFGMGTDGRDGCLLLISMAERDWVISTGGYGITAFTDAGIAYIGEELVDNGLSDGDYAEAFGFFAELCERFVNQARKGEPYDKGNMPVDVAGTVILSLVIGGAVGIIAAFITLAIMKSGMKSVAKGTEAGRYVKPGSMNLTKNKDIFLYANVSRIAKPKDTGSGSGGSSIHSGSSGISHGGGHGKF